jgi:hypothetical protein
MSKQYPGGLITKTPVTPAGPYEDGSAPGIWTLEEQAYWKKQGLWPTAGNVPTDLYFNYVTALFHGNGVNAAQNNTFLDSSTNNFTITRNGNTTQGTWSPYGSNWSNFLDGSGDQLTTPSQASFRIDQGNWTWEGWVFPTSLRDTNVLVSLGTGGSAVWYLISVGEASGTITFVTNSGTWNFTGVYTSSASVIKANQWNHFAVVYSGTTLYFFANGAAAGSQASPYLAPGQSGTLYMGSYFNNYNNDGSWYGGYVSNLRFVKGTAVYSGSTYTVPTAPLTAITNTSLLAFQSNRFIDNSTNAYTLTAAGDIKVQRFSPFAPTAAYSTSVIGGSGYFDGTGDYLTTPSSASISNFSGDFTIEGWVYLNATTAYGVLIGGDGSSGWYVEYGSARGFGAYDGSSFLNGSSTAVTNQWVNFAVTRASGTVRFFINGTLTASTSSANFNYTQSLGIAAYSGGSSSLNGYLSNIRINNTTALYTASYTPSTTPLTAVTNTQLLCNFTNAGILDNAMISDQETVGNAQVSTSIKKYGTGSMSFDGTGDRLVSAANPGFAFNTGDFTVEGWIYTNTLSGERGFIQTSDTAGGLKTSYTTGILFAIGTSPYTLNVNVGNTNVSSGSTYLAINTWYHVAVTRASGSVRLFINGALVGGPTTITANLTGQNLCIGGYYNTSYLWNGYVDDLRITKGYARYTAAFTAPTSQFPDQ